MAPRVKNRSGKKRTLPAAARRYMFKPGQSGNPKGRPPNPIPRILKELTVQTYRNLIEVVVSGNVDELKAMTEDNQLSALQVALARGFYRALMAGDTETIERLAARIVGKIPEELNVNSKNLNANVTVGNLDPVKVKAALAAIDIDV